MLKPIALSLASWIILAPGIGWSQTHEHQHEHKHEEAHKPGLELDHGKKWATDVPLREGMLNIRTIAQEAQKKPTSDENQRAANRMNEEIQKIFKNCKLTPKADAMLHVILADLMANIAKLKNPKANGPEAYAHIAKALDSYGQYFDHPGWDTSKKK